MRLWHSKLIPLLDGKRLCDLHMSCCNLRGNGWGKRNRNIDYIYDDPLGEDALAAYHLIVLEEMTHRGYRFDKQWKNLHYCGKNRPARHVVADISERVSWRNVPLKGHGVSLFVKDVNDLIERGLPLQMTSSVLTDCSNTYCRLYMVTDGKTKITYGVKLY